MELNIKQLMSYKKMKGLRFEEIYWLQEGDITTITLEFIGADEFGDKNVLIQISTKENALQDLRFVTIRSDVCVDDDLIPKFYSVEELGDFLNK